MYTCCIQNFKTLSSFCSYAGQFEFHLNAKLPKTNKIQKCVPRFSRDVAQLYFSNLMFLVPRVLVLWCRKITSQSNVSGNPRKMHVHCIHVEKAAASATMHVADADVTICFNST